MRESGHLAVENIDVFCEKGVFEIEDSRKIMEAGRAAGLRLNFHGDELHPLGGAELGGRLGAEAVSHLEEISDAGIRAMAASRSVAVMLLACVNLRMTLNEALAAATINAAHSIGRGASHGSIEVGKVGDMLVLSEKRWEHLVYQLGSRDVIRHVVKKGSIVV